MSGWYVIIRGEARGPVATEAVLGYLKTQNRRQTYVWREGFENWHLAKEVPELCGASAQRAPRRSAALRHLVSALTGILLLGLAGTLVPLAGSSKHDLALERQALDARSVELLARIALAGSPLACLDGNFGETVGSSCEKLLFASPEQAAAAMAYVSAQLALLADYAALRRRAGGEEPAGPISLRRVIEADRFGFVAELLATRDGCTPERCKALALLNDARRVRANLRERRFESYIGRYAATWPTGASHPLAPRDADGVLPAPLSAPEGAGTVVGSANLQNTLDSPAVVAASTPTSMPTPAGRPLRRDIFLPSASSIPAISIMPAESAWPGPMEHPGPKTGAVPPAKSFGTSAANASTAAKDVTAPGRQPIRSTDRQQRSVDSSGSQ